MLFSQRKTQMITKQAALPGRSTALPTAETHFVNGHALKVPYPPEFEILYLALGCYWGAERKFWPLPGVWLTAVGNIGGFTPNPTYEEVCSGLTGHTETVMVVYDPAIISTGEILKQFFESHDPTQGMRQGNDVGTQYRSAIFCTSAKQQMEAKAMRDSYQIMLTSRGYSSITTEIAEAQAFYFAEDYHQQYLAKNPSGYCGIGGTGISCPVGLAV